MIRGKIKDILGRWHEEWIWDRRIKEALRYQDFLYSLDPGYYIYKPSVEFAMIMNGDYDKVVHAVERIQEKISRL